MGRPAENHKLQSNTTGARRQRVLHFYAAQGAFHLRRKFLDHGGVIGVRVQQPMIATKANGLFVDG